MSDATDSLAVPRSRPGFGRLRRTVEIAAWVEHRAPLILLALLVLYVAVLFAASAFKYAHYGQGYDQVDFEQAIWNTLHGRPFADSRFNFTDSIFGLDWMPLLGAFVPFYALVPSPLTLFFLQIVAAAAGGWAVYQLARFKLGSNRHGLAFGLAWLLYPTIEYSALDPFQVRIFATVLLLFALLYFERGRLGPFVLCAGIALLARTDVALVVGMFGVYALLARKGWRWVVAPLVLGGVYFGLVMTFVVPAFVHLPPVNCSGPVPVAQMANAWPGSSNPNLGYYLHWGCTPGMILVNLVKDPLYTVRYMFGDSEKWTYLAALFAPFGFLSLLAPGRLLLSLPILGLNLIAWRVSQTDYRNHYQLLITVGVVASAIAGYEVLERRIRLWRGHGLDLAPAGMEARPAPTPSDVTGETRRMLAWRAGPLLALVLVALGVNLLLHNPVWRTWQYPETAARVAGAQRLVALVPPDAQVAASSFLAPHLLPRRYIYNFPPAPYSPYSMTDFKALDYLLVDPQARAIDFNKLADGRTALQAIEQSPQWTLLREDQGFRLYVRTHP